jgi:hypothetical protein
MSKIIIFVNTCKAYEESRAKLLEATWACSNNIVFITDNKESTLKNHICIEKGVDGFNWGPDTTTKMFMYFLSRYPDYDWFMMTDDDSYLYTDKLLDFLSFYDSNDCYMFGDFLNWPEYHKDSHRKDYLSWNSGGPGIVFSKSCIEEYMKEILKFRAQLGSHDLWLNNLYNCTDKQKIKRIHCPGFYQYGADTLLTKYDKSSKHIISVHLERNMNLLKDYHNSN